MNVEVRPPFFVHDLNTCVGCHACVLACVNENQLAPGSFWRQIVSFNAERVAGLPTFHLSLACNHCLDAPCLRYCPALAIARDATTGAVIIDAQACIGCRYCSWVCPYDAPRFNAARGVMEKCTFCHHRLRDGLAPACASLCPTGALRIDRDDGNRRRAVAGFSELGIRPAIRFVPLRKQEAPDAPGVPPEWRPLVVADRGDREPRKISLRSEWSLAAFTFTAIALVAWLTSSLAGGPRVALGPFLLAGTMAMGLSTLHLGRRLRAWRAVLNWRGSWLSREVIGYAAFLALAVVHLGVARPGPAAWIPGVAAACAGLLMLVSVDQVYAAMARPWRPRLDGVAAVASAALLAGVLAGAPLVFLAAGALRLAQWISRRRPARLTALGHPRVVIGLGLPLVLWVVAGPMGYGGAAWTAGAALACVMAGELADRCDFYDRLDVVTPMRQMAVDFAKCLEGPHPERA